LKRVVKMATQVLRERGAETLPAEIIGATENVRVSLTSDPPGRVEFGGSPRVEVSIHVGPSVDVACRRGGESHRGTVVHGDVSISPPHLGGVWELKERDTALIVGLNPAVLERVAEEGGGDPRALRVQPHFQLRDPQIEHIAWALKEEMEKGYPCGPLYLDSLATGLASILVWNYSSLARPTQARAAAMPPRRLKEVLGYVEDHLSRSLGLAELAGVAGLSTSHFKSVFQKTVGLPPHQYVIRRRVERAVVLLREGDMPIARVALDTGFCHQSHLAMHMQRVLGLSPRDVRERARRRAGATPAVRTDVRGAFDS
jgi:AraC family transcriptional regulator